ncbi:TIGR03618 family F420-dependent PPOX class oxidoreductase [Streptomyces sp. 3MP-14]|uniref:TIGR03618 family F420-dependent PPOX class oxidoreductase n=1 Tax=Streptomyces mimosae TaxID=2586635 RepID=A0A5N6AJ22_9ACTN|nr:MULTISPECIES: PPOX class F420-dependent oxidoreductase [Streptomyces]KAB8167870.1 TIGR03618 family F420-dependent PPOX class oxidoreductase [Streptomyces mimosae]KAB8177482.1 TIGR03618 family F420-dependent PPOX class oxidoreductase [Streptomyces sp. 3MP-14]
MAVTLSDELKRYLDETKVFATVATLQPDGSPHLTVVWIKRDGEDLLYSTTASRQQARNIDRDPRVTVMVNPADNPYTYAAIRGTATLAPDADREVIDELSRKYTGQSYAEFNPAADQEEQRLVVRITPTRVTGRL